MTKLEELKAAYAAAYDAWEAARDTAWAIRDATPWAEMDAADDAWAELDTAIDAAWAIWDAADADATYAAAWGAYYEELEKTQGENNND
jgi:hypothetical protein